MYSFPNLEPVHCSRSGSNCCFLTSIQFLWRQVRWSSIPISLRIFCFSTVDEAEIDTFLELSCFFNDPANVGYLFTGSSAFSKSSWDICNFSVHILLKPRLKDFEHYLATVWHEYNCAVVWISFGIAFLGEWNENWHFPVLWPLLSFPNLLAYWVQHFHSIIF